MWYNPGKMKKTILIVEDDADLRVFLRKILAANNFRVLEAADGAEALEKVENELPELVILDFGLPLVPGETVCVKIKENHPEIIVIAVTEKKLSSDVVRGLQIGADDYISKPFVAEELIARIDARLKNVKSEDAPVKTKSQDLKSNEPRLVFRESVVLIAIRLIMVELLFGLTIVLSTSLFSLLGTLLQTSNTFALNSIILVTIFISNIVFVVFIILKWGSEFIELTQDSLIKHKGILNKTEEKYACNFVETITIEQSMLGIMFNYGTIELYDPALKERIYLVNIASPKKYREIIEKRVSKGRDRPIPFVAQQEGG